MSRARISTTVDPALLEQARALEPSGTDARMIERALQALLASSRRAHIDEAYARGYSEHPLEEPDEWGDLASFGTAVRAR